MLEAPIGAVYVWCNSRERYARDLARHLGRNDLVVQPRSWLQPLNVRGRQHEAIVVDHATDLEPGEGAALSYAQSRGTLVSRWPA